MTTVQIPRRNRRPATTAQHGMWFTERLGTAGSAYHMPVPIRLDGELDVPALIDACAAVVARHPVLGSAFEEHDGELFAVPALVSPRVTLTTVTPPDPATTCGGAARTSSRVWSGPRRCGRSTCGTGRWSGSPCSPGRRTGTCCWSSPTTSSSTANPRTSSSVTWASCTGRRTDGRTPDLPSLPVAYADHAGAEPARLAAELASAGEFWGRHWREPAPVVLPGLHRQQPGAQPGATVDRLFDQRLRTALAGTADLLGATRFEVLLAALQAVLHRYGNAEPTVAVDLGTRTPLDPRVRRAVRQRVAGQRDTPAGPDVPRPGRRHPDRAA